MPTNSNSTELFEPPSKSQRSKAQMQRTACEFSVLPKGVVQRSRAFPIAFRLESLNYLRFLWYIFRSDDISNVARVSCS